MLCPPKNCQGGKRKKEIVQKWIPIRAIENWQDQGIKEQEDPARPFLDWSWNKRRSDQLGCVIYISQLPQ